MPPRTPTPQSNGARTPSNESSHHPDLASEVATLSTKLINAINHQTNLDDTLQSTRHELESARERIAQLESAAKEHESMISSGALVTSEQINKTEQTLKTEAADERLKRIGAERDRKKMELELERLTSELFEEANLMVADARREKQEAEQQKEQYQAQLRDAEILLASHQEQLRELKGVMQQLHTEERVDETTQQPSAPSTPIGVLKRKSDDFPSESNQHQTGQTTQVIFPDHPLSFSQLLSPVLRSDIQAYDDFVQLLKMGSGNSPKSRVHSGNFAGLNVMGLGSLSNPTQSKVERPQYAPKSSNSSLSTSSPAPPNMPGSFNSTTTTDTTSSPATGAALKDAKYYKRAITEDIEPTLRLDTAPGLSWLARRNVISSMAAGNLFVEPLPSGSYSIYSAAFPCGLCGEAREGETYTRRHRFRTSDNDEAQRYPICDFCVGRLRATGDFVNFLRMVRAGYWRGESVEEARLAWEECVKLRERMFWSRIGGGVVPNASYESPITPRKLRHNADRSVSSTNLGGSVLEDAVETTTDKTSEPEQASGTTELKAPKPFSQPLPDNPPVGGDKPGTHDAVQQNRNSSPSRNPQVPVAEAAPHAESEPPSRSRGKSVEALRSRFETSAASPPPRPDTETSRSPSRQRTKSRTPSPQKQS